MNIRKMYLNTLSMVLALNFLSSCIKKKQDQNNQTLSIEGAPSEDLTAKLSTPDELCKYIDENKFYDRSFSMVGKEVAFSTSYGVDTKESSTAEAGQAFGTVNSDGYFEQKDFVTTQLLVCPGAFNGLYSGKCAWNIQDYAKLAYEVVCNKARTYGSPMKFHPGFNGQTVKTISNFKASTAGKTYNVGNAAVLMVELLGPSTGTSAMIYFAKGIGFIASEFREKDAPDGTAKVYAGKPGT
jgi:hypothetical protein